MQRFAVVPLVALCVVLLAGLRASAAGIAPLPSALTTYQSGSMRVEEFGAPSQPSVVLIPGLACGPWVWSAEIQRLSPSYHIYALTLPGFDGVAPLAKPPYFDQVAADFWKFLDAKRVERPLLVGHSLGGTLALRLATEFPARLRGVVAVDGLPVFPGFGDMPSAQRRAIAQQIKSSIADASHDKFLAMQQQQVLPSMISSKDAIAQAAPLVARSDPAATGEWFSEDVLLDDRPLLPKAKVAILEIAPYDAAVDGVPPISLASPDAKKQYYTSLLRGAPSVQVVVIPNSRHFIMFDQPAALDTQLDGFMAAHKP